MAKVETQTRMVVVLKAFTGQRPSSYVNETEFFLVSLQDMEGYLDDLQKEALKVACDSFTRKLDLSKVTPKTLEDFEAALSRLVSGADLRATMAVMAGSKQLIKERLSRLQPVSLVASLKKSPGTTDREVENKITSAYDKLQFPVLARMVEASPSESSASAVLEKARKRFSEYCTTYCIPMNAAATFKPISLSCIDAALSACHMLLKNIRKSLGSSFT